jgi:hypothetical protein
MYAGPARARPAFSFICDVCITFGSVLDRAPVSLFFFSFICFYISRICVHTMHPISSPMSQIFLISQVEALSSVSCPEAMRYPNHPPPGEPHTNLAGFTFCPIPGHWGVWTKGCLAPVLPVSFSRYCRPLSGSGLMRRIESLASAPLATRPLPAPLPTHIHIIEMPCLDRRTTVLEYIAI